jgi:hypothetical protein
VGIELDEKYWRRAAERVAEEIATITGTEVLPPAEETTQA